ncbi:50S ribosomal protein L29 [Candidatus Woesearchaeota archaeon]|nr:50S ribosomal protein L29 [Candidatus Woesearchaeota archaeon]
MSVKKIKELRSLNEKELSKRLEDLRKELIKLNAQVATGTVPKSPGLIRNTKKSIAMIMTLLREKELENAAEESSQEVQKTNE